MALENGVVLEVWRSAVNIPLYKDKRKMTKWKSYRDINLLNLVGKYMQKYYYTESI